MITNAYVIYLHVNLENGMKKAYLLSQHDFRKAVALAWINPSDQYEELPAPVSTRKRKSISGSNLSSLSGCSNTCRVAEKTDLNLKLTSSFYLTQGQVVLHIDHLD